MRLMFADRSGFPMIFIDPIKAYLHFLPVTKIQIERFLCRTDDSSFDEEWYKEMLRQNPRVSSVSLRSGDEFKVWASGVLPSEAQAFCDWSGQGMRLPTHQEWFLAYQFLKQQAPEKNDWRTAPAGLSARTCHLLENLPAGNPTSLAEQMYLRNGVFEFVELSGKNERWGGMGYPPLKVHSHTHNPDLGHYHPVRAPELNRRFYYGFRGLVPAG